MPMIAPRKASVGIAVCSHCRLPCKNESYTLSHKFTRDKKVRSLVFCSRECLMEMFEEELFLDKLHAAVEKEKRFLQKRVCPACVRRMHQIE